MESTLTEPGTTPSADHTPRSVEVPAVPRTRDGKPPALAFLTYMNRSGSTLLARLLDAYVDVAVSLEAQFPDTIVVRGYRVRDEAELERFLDRIFADPKFSSWGVDRRRLKSRLVEEGFPVPYSRFLRLALAEHFAETPARVHLYKNSRYLERPDRVRELFPDAKLVYVMRDPRAVHASQKRSLDSRSGKPMSSNPALTAREYLRTIREVERLKDEPWFHLVRYEDLVERPEEEVGRVLDFLGASREKTDATGDYAAKIPDGQKHLHRNVGSAPIKSRTDAWRTELTGDLPVLERIAGRSLARWGYEPTGARPRSLGERVSQEVTALSGTLLYLAKRARWSLRTRPFL